MKDGTPLADTLKELRRELEEAWREGEGKDIRFGVDSIDVELQVTVSKSAEAGADFKLWVINGDAKGEVAGESLQKLHLTLSPYRVDDKGNREPLLINDTRRRQGPNRRN
ncbi:hypothetical protein McPS_32400 [Marichromatium sp. PS1]|uniref:trypco2 family protein n=1 Tax=Marichromatium sp. PS1 TaxID=3138932 RepID=UPI0032E5B565